MDILASAQWNQDISQVLLLSNSRKIETGHHAPDRFHLALQTQYKPHL
jgi:hypothetical protein